MFHPSPVGYFRLGVSAPRRELREGYRQQARRRHRHVLLTSLITKVATDYATGVEQPRAAATLTRTDAATGVTKLGLGLTVTDVATGHDAGAGAEAWANQPLQFLTTTDHGTSGAASRASALILATATDHATGGQTGAVFAFRTILATDGATGGEARAIFSGIARGATYRDQQTLGRYQVGEHIGLAIVCIGPTGPVRPDAVRSSASWRQD